jgi:murein DD-endopeptidase MepM/ murein hydrolase activator NlpD
VPSEPSTAPPAWRKSKGPSVGERRYTLMFVPEGGRGSVRQISLSLRQVRQLLMLATVVALLAVAGLLWFFVGMPRQFAYAELAEENLALKERLQKIEGSLDEVEAALRRLRMYEAQLRGIDPAKIEDAPAPANDATRGEGPLDDDELAAQQLATAWSVLDVLDAPPDLHEVEDAPMDELGDEFRYLESSFKELDMVALRSERLEEVLQVLEPQLAMLAESAEDYRSMLWSFPSINPCPEAVLTSGFGYRRSPFTRRWKFHTGLDLAGPVGLPIVAPAPGIVIQAGFDSGYGRSLQIDHGYGLVSRFAHTSKLYVGVGDKVDRGQLIAAVGSSGQVTGPHLHYEVMVNGERVDPMFYISRAQLPK